MAPARPPAPPPAPASPARRPSRAALLPRAVSLPEQLLLALGADPAMLDAVVGDLTEEHALRVRRDGPWAARRWLAGQVVRSTPGLVAGAWARGTPAQRRRLAGVAAGLALLAALGPVAWQARRGPAVHLATGRGAAVTVSGFRPVQLPLEVRDVRGHLLRDVTVTWDVDSGRAALITPRGVATCTGRGDVHVRARAGRAEARTVVRCQPLLTLSTPEWVDFVAGEPPRPLDVGGLSVDLRAVDRLSATLEPVDSAVATVAREGGRFVVRPVAPGRTLVHVRAGERTSGSIVTVFAPVPTLAGLTDADRQVMAPYTLAPGETVRWPLPQGLFWLVTRHDGQGWPVPTVRASGAVVCMPALETYAVRAHCRVRAPGAWVTVTNPGRDVRGQAVSRVITGALGLDREEIR